MGMTVGEAMIARPKTLRADALIDDVRRVFENSSVRTVLLADDGLFRGAVERDLVPRHATGDEPASRYIESDPATTVPGMPVSDAIELLDARAEPRLIVLDDDGVTLRGLLCFNRSSSGFCVK